MLSTLSSRREVRQCGFNYFFSYFGYGKCSWLLHMQMVRPESLDSQPKRTPMDWSSMGVHCVSLELFLFWLLLYYFLIAFMSIPMYLKKSAVKAQMLLFTPFPATRFAMHRIYANRINSRGMSRVFCDLRSQKTPRGILPVNSNAQIDACSMIK